MKTQFMANLTRYFKRIFKQSLSFALRSLLLVSCILSLWGVFEFTHHPPRAWAGSSVTVSTQDPVYRRLDRLASFGLIKTMMVGQRPYVRSEIARLIAEALENYPKLVERYRSDTDLSVKRSSRWLTAKVWIDRTLEKLKVSYRLELIEHGALPGVVPTFYGQPMEYIQADYRYLDETPTQILGENGVGGISARRQPLVELEEGRHYQPGSNWAFETLHWGRLSKYFSLQFQPRFQAQIANAPFTDETKLFVHRLNAHATFGKLDIEIGRDLINWGLSDWGGLAFSQAHRPLDFIKVSSTSPFEYPFFFRQLGKNEMSLVVANLGGEQSFSDPWLVAYKISNRRDQYFELGISHAMLIGGDGAPSSSFGRSVVDFFDLRQNDNRVSRAWLVELNGQIPAARGLQLYSQISFGDFTSNLGTLFKTNTSYLVGLNMPRLDFAGRFSLRLEYRRLNPRYLRSALYLSGFTENQRTLGDPLGPESQGIFARLNYDFNATNQLNFAFEYRQYGQNLYLREGTNVTRVNNISDEERFLYRLSLRHLFNRHWMGEAFAGFEHVDDFNNLSGQNEFFWQLGLKFRVYLDPIADI